MHFKCSISTIFVNKTLKLQKSIKMKRVQAMAVTGRVQNVDLDLGLDSSRVIESLGPLCTALSKPPNCSRRTGFSIKFNQTALLNLTSFYCLSISISHSQVLLITLNPPSFIYYYISKTKHTQLAKRHTQNSIYSCFPFFYSKIPRINHTHVYIFLKFIHFSIF